jgi:hypothetical protein
LITHRLSGLWDRNVSITSTYYTSLFGLLSLVIVVTLSAILLFGESCTLCNRNVLKVLGVPVSTVAVVGYGSVIALKLVGRTMLASLFLIALAGGHAAVFSFFYRYACPLCFGVLAFAGISVLIDFATHQKNRQALALLFLTVVTIVSIAIRSSGILDQYNPAADAFIQKTLEGEPVDHDKVCVHVFADNGCPACRRFMADYLPQLRALYGNKLAIKMHQAIPGMQIPTIIEAWPRPTTIRGLPTFTSLTAMLDHDISGGIK